LAIPLLLAVLMGCHQADGPRPPVVHAPAGAQDLAVYVDPTVDWATPEPAESALAWSKAFMNALPRELAEHGFVVVPDRQSGAELAVDVAIDASSPAVTVELALQDAAGGRGTSKVASSCSDPRFCARAITNALVQSDYLLALAEQRAALQTAK
jgi:hypothetical protein